MDTKTLAENLQFLLDKARMAYGLHSEIKLVSRFCDNNFQISFELYDSHGNCCMPNKIYGYDIVSLMDELSKYIMKQLKIHNERRVSILEKQILVMKQGFHLI